jgi:multicomponent Na+:H+ antiporter subunit E
VPGSVVIDMDRGRRTLSLHILHVRDLADVERRRAAVLAEEERVVRAFGSPEQIAALAHVPGVAPAGSGRGTP